MDPCTNNLLFGWVFGLSLLVAAVLIERERQHATFLPRIELYGLKGAPRQVFLAAARGAIGGGVVTLVLLPYLFRVTLFSPDTRSTLNPAFVIPLASMAASLGVLAVKSGFAWWMSLFPSVDDRGGIVALRGGWARLEARKSLVWSAALAAVCATFFATALYEGVPAFHPPVDVGAACER